MTCGQPGSTQRKRRTTEAEGDGERVEVSDGIAIVAVDTDRVTSYGIAGLSSLSSTNAAMLTRAGGGQVYSVNETGGWPA